MMNGPIKKSDLLPKKEKNTRLARFARRVRGILSSNWFLRIFSVLIAVFLWGVLIASDGTLLREKIFQDVEVTVTGADTLRTRGFIVLDDVASLIPTVRMRVEVPQANYSRATGSSYNPRIDLTRIRAAGTQEVEVTTSTSYGRVLEVVPASVTVNVDEYALRERIPVVVETTGALADGLWADTSRSDPSYVAIGGPQTLVSKVTRAVATLDLATLTKSPKTQRNAVAIELQDADGNVIDSPLIEITNQSVIIDSITIETDVYPCADLPVDVSTAITGDPATGYQVDSVVASPASVRVAGDAAVLETLTSAIAAGQLSVEDASETVTGAVQLHRMPDLQYVSVSEVLITADIVEQQRERTFKNVAITVQGAADDRTVLLDVTRTTVQLTGGYSFIQTVTAEDVQLYVDVSGLAPGQYELPVQCRIDNAPAFSCALANTSVAVTITEAK